MRATRWSRPALVVMAVGLVAAACGSSTKGATTTSTSSAPTTAAATTTTAAATTTPTTAAATVGDVIPKGTGRYGQDATTKTLYVGAGGFQVDTTKCPADWNLTQGITAQQIDLFESLPKAGPLAGFGLIADGAQSYFDYVNANGGIGGRKIVLTAKDDGYKPDVTKTNVDEALQAKKYAAMLTVLGTPNNLAVWDELNKECMPQVLNGTGAAQWGDVETHPWTTGMQLDYFSEAKLWAKWLESKFPNGAKVAAIVYNNDFGKSYEGGFKDAIKGTNLTLVKEEFHDATAPNLDNQFTSLSATNADVLLLATTGAFCTQGMAAVEKGSWHPTVVMSGTCGSIAQFFKPLIAQGLTGKGTNIIQTFLDVNDPANANLPIVKTYNDWLPKDTPALDPKKTTYFTGWIFAWYMTEILMEANSYKGGLDRANIMIAARSIDQTSPLLIKGLTSKMDGLKDAYLTEGGQMVTYNVTDPTKLGTFAPAGDLINLEGQLGSYATVKKALTGA